MDFPNCRKNFPKKPLLGGRDYDCDKTCTLAPNLSLLSKSLLNTFLLFSFSISLGFYASSQDYFAYNHTWNRIDEDLSAQDYMSCCSRLDSLYEHYSFIYAQHCFKALQICAVNKDSLRASLWLKKAFLQGVNPWMIRANGLTNKLLEYGNCEKIMTDYPHLHAQYLQGINHTIRSEIDSLIEIDQACTEKVNNGFFLFRYTVYAWQWLNNNKRQFARIQEITNSYSFPSERLIGLPKTIQDSSINYKNFVFYGPNLGETHAYIMLIHYFSNPRPDNSQNLLSNVKNGFLPAYQFGALNDFRAKWGKGKHGVFNYYNVWHTDENPAHLQEINARRIAIGLNHYERQQQHLSINRERRKQKTANQEVVLE